MIPNNIIKNNHVNVLLTFSSFCLASLMTFINSSFLVFVKDFVNELGLPSADLLCFELILLRAKKKKTYIIFIYMYKILLGKKLLLFSPRSDKLPGPSRAACKNDDDV